MNRLNHNEYTSIRTFCKGNILLLRKLRAETFARMTDCTSKYVPLFMFSIERFARESQHAKSIYLVRQSGEASQQLRVATIPLTSMWFQLPFEP